MSKRDDVLIYLGEHAPDMKLKDALTLANDMHNIYTAMIDSAEALAVLSSILLASNGAPLSADVKTSRPAIQLAYERLTYRHAWVSCGPGDDGMEKLLERWDDYARKVSL